MGVVKRDIFTFVGGKAEDAGKYYDIAFSHGGDIDFLYLAWDACHKFGCRLLGDNIASYRDGIVIGKNALPAAEFIDEQYTLFRNTLPERNRKTQLNAEMQKVFAEVINRYGVQVKPM